MRLLGKLTKYKKSWLAEIPALNQMSSGKTKKAALSMLKEALELLIEEYKLSPCKFSITLKKDNIIFLDTDNSASILGLALRRMRQNRTQKEMCQILQYKSIYAYQQYESGKREPTLSMATKLLKATNSSAEIVLMTV
jgi:predicted RNase H-like HicB family nuclease